MKNKASSVVKYIISFLSSIGSKAKADALRTRFIVLSLLKSESRPSLTTSISHKFHPLLDRKTERDEVESGPTVLHNASSSLSHNGSFNYGYGDDDDDDDGSVIDQAKNSKEHQRQDFVLENEIDQVADLFIKRFYNQLLLQNSESFKRFQQMLKRSV